MLSKALSKAPTGLLASAAPAAAAWAASGRLAGVLGARGFAGGKVRLPMPWEGRQPCPPPPHCLPPPLDASAPN